jgi:hypothetical protein
VTLSLNQELFLRERDRIAYPLRKFSYTLGLKLRYDNSVDWSLGLVFREPATPIQTQQLHNFFSSRGFQLKGSTFSKTYSEAESSCVLFATVSPTSILLTGSFDAS